MEIIEVKIGEQAQLAAMTPRQAAAHVYELAEVFKERAAEVIDRCRAALPGEQASKEGTLSMSAKGCGGCGTYVEPGVKYCATCREKPQYAAPKASMEVGKQPDPAYRDAPIGQVVR
jgi:hypothetical protein